MKTAKTLGLIVAIILFTGSSIFAESADQWAYSKEVRYENKEEVKAIYLDEEIYPYVNKDLSDLRLINDKNEFVPYYIYNGYLKSTTQEHVSYPSKEILTYRKDSNYYVDFQITPRNEKEDVVGNILDIEVTKDSFYKEIDILGSYDNKTWDTIKSDTIYHINGQSKRVVSLGDNYKYLYYRVISKNDLGDVPVSYLSLVYDQVESTYDQHKQVKLIDYEVETNHERKETTIKIHNKDRLRISNIGLKSRNDFNRAYTLYVTNEKGDERRGITSGYIYKFSLEEFQVEDMDIPLQAAMEDFTAPEYLEIVIKNQDDQPIEIEAIDMEYYIDKLVFKTSDPKGIQLLFGNELAQKPLYDISSYMVEMEKSVQEKAELSALVSREVEVIGEKEAINFKLILNIAVVIISGLLGVVILKKK